jgi:hypothetical protein
MGNPWEMVEHKNGNLVSYEDYARLKAEVDSLTELNATLKDALNTIPEWAKVLETEAENARLKAEVERLTKAGDALVFCMNLNSASSGNALRNWEAAKGKQS